MKRMIDQELFDAKLDAAGVETLLASGDVPEIHADEIVEQMTGYSFTAGDSLPTETNITYAGVVKNGNKLTFAIAMSILLSEATSTGNLIGTFTIPSDIGEKLFPFIIGGSHYLDVKDIFFAKDGTSGVNAKGRFIKNSNTEIVLNLRYENFQANTQYYGRFECTFLLSDNLAA